MGRYRCPVCGYVYDEKKEGKSWSSLPHEWTCPVCGASRSMFEPLDARPEKARGSVPRRAVMAHRVFGYVFLAIYILLLAQMIPRLWTYQIEFPPRTAVHITLGMAIGVLLILKIAIVRFFRGLEATLAPSLGTLILVSSVVLIGISVPSAFREALATAELFTEENRQRVRDLLAQTGLQEAESERLASPDSLRKGQQVLRRQCVGCHDLRTVMAIPRTPENWRRTVRRMAERTTILNPLEEEEEWLVTAYLVAISPQLQRSVKTLREQRNREAQSNEALEAAVGEDVLEAYDPSEAKKVFDKKCSQCHWTKLVDKAAPASKDEAKELVGRMIKQGLEATEREIAQIVRYLAEKYRQE